MEQTMISQASAASLHKRRGFTLVELLVVIGIIVLLVSIAIPTVMHAYKIGDRTRSAADIQAISMALEAFKGDNGDYPRPAAPNLGFVQLGRYLIGPYGDGSNPTTDPPTFAAGTYNTGDCVKDGSYAQYVCMVDGTTTSPSAAIPWVQVSPAPTPPATTGFANDGANGPGLKINSRGKTLGPYLQPDKFKVRGLAILDRAGAPILYFVRAPGQHNTHVVGQNYVGATGSGAAYISDDNEFFFRVSGENSNTDSTYAIQVLMGDTNGNGYLDPTETTEVTLPYVLWSSGPDGLFGPARLANADPRSATVWTQDAIEKCDDVMNFK